MGKGEEGLTRRKERAKVTYPSILPPEVILMLWGSPIANNGSEVGVSVRDRGLEGP